MAEFCYKCFCDFWETEPKKAELVFSKNIDLCEGCGKYKKIVIAYKTDLLAYRFRHVIKLLKIITAIILLPFYPLIIRIQKNRK